jgi:hypothetical protein
MRSVFISAAVTAAAIVSLSSARAQTADFACPPKGTTYVTRGSDGVEATYVTTGQEGDACTSQRTSDGKTMVLREHWNVIGSVDPAGEAYARALNLKSLWPLRVGNSLTQDVHATGYDGKPYTSKVSITVAAYEKVTVPAGTFDAFRIEERKEGDTTPRLRWWAPSIAMTVKQSFPDWRDRSKVLVYELAAIRK